MYWSLKPLYKFANARQWIVITFILILEGQISAIYNVAEIYSNKEYINITLYL